MDSWDLENLNYIRKKSGHHLQLHRLFNPHPQQDEVTPHALPSFLDTLQQLPSLDLNRNRLEDCYLLDEMHIRNETLLPQEDEEEEERTTPPSLSPSPSPSTSISCAGEECAYHERYERERGCPWCPPQDSTSSSGSSVLSQPRLSHYVPRRDSPYYVRLRQDLYMTPPPPPISTPTRFGVDRKGQLMIDYSHNWTGLELFIKQLKT